MRHPCKRLIGRAKIGPYSFPVYLNDHLDETEEADGVAHNLGSGIEIQGNLSTVRFRDALIHEFIEMSNFVRDLQLPHHCIQVLATDLAQMLGKLLKDPRK